MLSFIVNVYLLFRHNSVTGLFCYIVVLPLSHLNIIVIISILNKSAEH